MRKKRTLVRFRRLQYYLEHFEPRNLLAISSISWSGASKQLTVNLDDAGTDMRITGPGVSPCYVLVEDISTGSSWASVNHSPSFECADVAFLTVNGGSFPDIINLGNVSSYRGYATPKIAVFGNGGADEIYFGEFGGELYGGAGDDKIKPSSPLKNARFS